MLIRAIFFVNFVLEMILSKKKRLERHFGGANDEIHIYGFCHLIGKAVFHVGIPVGICWSVVRKMGGTPILGIVLGLTLVSGQLLNAYAVATTPPDQVPHWDFGGFTVN